MKTYQFAISLGLLFSAQPAHSNVDKKITNIKAGPQQAQSSPPVTVNVQPTGKPTPLEQADQVANIVGTGVVAGKTALDVYIYLCPSEEKKLREAQAKIELQKLLATMAVRECFVKQRKTLKDADNIPYLCKEKFEEFVAVATAKEVEETKWLINLK